MIKAELAGYESFVSDLLTLDQQQEHIGGIGISIEPDKKISVERPYDLTKPAFMVYPNPSTDYFKIELAQREENIQTVELILLRTTGEMVMKQKLQFADDLVRVDIQDLPIGMYILHLILGDKQHHAKIIKKR
jgi:hypothetical protein